MSKYKVFISHSSAQKAFVEKLVKLIGKDYVYVDEYNFEAGSNLTKEMETYISNTSIFILLLSDEALDSDWVKKEVLQAKMMVVDQEIRGFIPFIIDDRISHDDPRFQNKEWKWILNHLLDNINSEHLVARVVKRKLNEIILEDNPELKERSRLFVGRDKEMTELQRQLFDNISNEKRAVIVSGLAHLGRKRLLKEFINKNIDSVHVGYDPIRIMLTETDDIDSLIQQLNDIVGIFDNNTLLEKLKDTSQRISLAVQMLNSISSRKEKLFVRDEKCIVLGNGKLVEWFVDLIRQKALMPQIHFFIASKCTPRQSVSMNFHELIVLPIYVLERPSMKVLFNAYAKIRNISLSENDAKFFLDRLNGYPMQVYHVVDNIKNKSLYEAKKLLPEVIDMFSCNLSSVIKEVEKTDHAKDILVLLSKFEFISYELLEEICPDDIKPALELFDSYALYESFGTANEYLRLSPVMTNYISRSKMELPHEYMKRLKETTRKVLKELGPALTDLSKQLFAAKNVLLDYESKSNEQYLLPHYVLKVIVDEYNKKNDKNVILLAEKLLNDRMQNNYDEIERSIRYWYCCALCRQKDRKFLTAVTYFKDASYSYNFLRGFYERCLGHNDRAQEYYEKALEMSKGVGEHDFRSKAEHELVLVMMNQGYYVEALPQAEKNYQHDKENTYQIEAYFRCLVKSPHPDKDMLNTLIASMEKSYAKDKEVLLTSMNAEYEYYIRHDFSKAVKILNISLKESMHRYTERTLKEICKRQDAMSVYNAIIKETSR